MNENDFVVDVDLFFSDFKSLVNIDGSVVEAIVESIDASKWMNGAIEKAEVRVHVRSRDIPQTTARQPGGVVVVDGKRFVIVNRTDDLGMTTFDFCRGRGY